MSASIGLLGRSGLELMTYTLTIHGPDGDFTETYDLSERRWSQAKAIYGDLRPLSTKTMARSTVDMGRALGSEARFCFLESEEVNGPLPDDAS